MGRRPGSYPHGTFEEPSSKRGGNRGKVDGLRQAGPRSLWALLVVVVLSSEASSPPVRWEVAERFVSIGGTDVPCRELIWRCGMHWSSNAAPRGTGW